MSLNRITARVSLGAIQHNIDIMKARSDGSLLMPVIKADGYGHGAIPIASMLDGQDGIWGFATATSEEALSLRKAGVKNPVLVLGFVFPEDNETMIRNDLRFTVFTKEDAKTISDSAVSLWEKEPTLKGIKARVHIKVDTGMSRIGIVPDCDGVGIVKYISALPGIETEGVFTHFARADEKDRSNVAPAFERFDSFVKRLKEELGLNIPLVHCQNSAAGLRGLVKGMNLIRPGIVIYGLWPSGDMEKEHEADLIPALSLESRVIHIKEVPEGTPVSYGGTYVTDKPTVIATIPVGYADGYPRQLSNKGFVLIKGKRAPIIGRVCMDQLMVDITGIPDVKCNDTVVLIGKSGKDTITAEELGDLSGRFNYELVCCLTPRVPRIYTE